MNKLKIAIADLTEEILYTKYILLGQFDVEIYERWLEIERSI